MTVKDTSWIRNNFGPGRIREYNDYNRYNRTMESWLNFQDTTLGGNFAINAPYQFTRYADIKEPRLTPEVGKGMGRWYSSNIQKWGHNVHFRCGVPAYSGLLTYAMSATDGATARMVATGRTPGIFNAVGAITGFIISAAFWEITLVATLINKFIEFTSTRYYYLKPTMFQYWSTVQTMLNSLSANLGLTVSASVKKTGNTEDNESNWEQDSNGHFKTESMEKSLLDNARNALPDVFKKPAFGEYQDIGVDIHAVATRAQALQVQQQEYLEQKLEEFDVQGLSSTEIARRMEQYYLNGPVNGSNNNGILKPTVSNGSLDAYKKQWMRLKGYGMEVEENQVGKALPEDNKAPPQGVADKVKSWFKETVDSWSSFASDNPSLANAVKAEFRDGSAWFSLRVAGTDSVGESFSNSTTDAEIAGMYNSIAEKARAFQFNTSGGKTGIGMVDGMIEGVTGAVGDYLTSAQSNTEMLKFMNPIISAMYGAQIAAPKRWSGSSSSPPSMSFKLELRAGYGNVISYYQDILVPLCMMLVAGLPRGAGPQAYGSPFYVEYYSKGRSQSRIGLITSISVERGVGNKGWTRRGLPLGVDVSVTVSDMTEMVFSPTTSNLSIFGKWINPMEENAMGDYMAVLSALGMNEQIYFLPKMKRRFNKFLSEMNSWTSPSRWAAMGAQTWPGMVVSAFSDQTARK